MWYWTIAIVVVILVLTLFYTGYLNPRATTIKAVEGPFKLESPLTVSTTEAAQSFLNGNTGSVQFFVNVLPFQKTGQATSCSTNPGDPTCSTDRYNICPCVMKDCSQCYHKGYNNIFNVSGVLKMEVLSSPDASRPGQASVQLAIKTYGIPVGKTAEQTLIETFSLPPLPFQKWVGVTISREGRRFDVFYNKDIVLSKRTQYSVDHASVASAPSIGDSKINGQFAFLRFYDDRLDMRRVGIEYRKVTDTRGAPQFTANMNILASLNPCPNGACLQPITVRPASPLYSWDTQYD
jgi:hypothetical protein